MNDPRTDELCYFAGIRVFFNPRIFIEMTEMTQYYTKILVIHTTLEVYYIEQQYIISYHPAPNPCIALTSNIGWRLETELSSALHNFYKLSRSAQTIYPFFQFTYYNVERIEHSDGSMLWQKKR